MNNPFLKLFGATLNFGNFRVISEPMPMISFILCGKFKSLHANCEHSKECVLQESVSQHLNAFGSFIRL